VSASQTSAAENSGTATRHPSQIINLPDLILIDGGKGQLSAACAELEKLGLEKIPVIGLAKEFEEILSARKKFAVAVGPGSSGGEIVAAHPRRMSSRGEFLQCAIAAQADFRERAG